MTKKINYGCTNCQSNIEIDLNESIPELDCCEKPDLYGSIWGNDNNKHRFTLGELYAWDRAKKISSNKNGEAVLNIFEQNNIVPKISNLKSEFLELISGREKKWQEATEILVEYIKSNNYIYTTKDDVKSEVWIYKEGVYVPQGRSEIKIILRDILEEWYSQYIFGLVINKIEVDTFIDADKFFSLRTSNQVPVLNGILDIITKELTPFTPEKIFFNKLPVTFDPSKECPLIDSFLESTLKDKDDKHVFYELGGFCLLGEYRFEKSAMFIGNGRNGKDKSLELIKRLLGAENCCAIPLHSLDENSFTISELHGKKANLAGDIGGQDLKDMSTFKALTGRSLINGKRKFMRDIIFVNHAKFIFACNNLPMVYDMSKGFWDRWILLEFPYTFVTQEEYDKSQSKEGLKIRDDQIIEKITSSDELSGLLNKFLEGLERLIKNKKFSSTRGSEEVKQLWIRKSNSFIAFCMDKIEDSFEGKISKRELRKEYSKYCKEHKVIPKSDIVVKRTLQETYGANEKDELLLGGSYERYWEGITWK